MVGEFGEVHVMGWRLAKVLGTNNLTDEERLAIVTGDINWIEKHIGELTKNQKSWLLQKLSAEIW